MRRSALGVASCVFVVFGLNASSPDSSAAPRDAPFLPAGLPPGYGIDLVAEIQWPAEVQCVGDGRCFIASVHDSNDGERSGIYLVYPDKTRQRIFTGPRYGSIQHLGEKGLTGMALHPNFAEDDRIFFYWSGPDTNETSPTHTFVSSIRSDGSDERLLWGFTPDAYTNIHVAGGLVTYREKGRDYLFVAVGNYDNDRWSQDLMVDQGKIHRFEIVGDSLQIPADNPFYNTPGAKKSIWAYGFRNPFRIHRDPATGKVYINENGRSCSDRVFLLVKGGNYGWPSWDNCKNNNYNNYVQPIYEFVTTMGITDIEIYHGPIPGWEGKAFICGFNTVPLYMLTVLPDGRLGDRQAVTGASNGCILALGVRADGALLYTRQTQFGLDGQVLAIVPLNPGPRIAATLSADATRPAPGQRMRYTLDLDNLSFANNFTATIQLPNQLNYLAGSTFGGWVYNGAARRLQWTGTLEQNRDLRAGFDVIASALPGAPVSVTAQIAERYGQQIAATAIVTVGAGSPVDYQMIGDAPYIRSGENTTYTLLVRNRSITGTTFSLTTTLPGAIQFLSSLVPGTVTYDNSLRAVQWQRPLKADRQAVAGIAVRAGSAPASNVTFTSTLVSGASTQTFLTHLLLEPYRAFLALVTRSSGAAPAGAPFLLEPQGHPFGRDGAPPGSIDNLAGAGLCQQCHNVTGSSIFAAWSTSAHGYGAVDPVFKAALHNATRQVKDVDRWCTQCHEPGDWLAGHPTNAQDTSAVTCSVCHRAVDSESDATIDQAAIQRATAMGVIPPRWKEIGGNGALILDHNDVRRGTNFWNTGAPHGVSQSPFLGSSALCGACHSVYAPHLARDEVSGEFVPGLPDVAGGENPLFLQSTYPEWLNSQYAAQGAQCQDCHMPSSPGYVASPDKGGQLRDVPSHTFAGGNLFILDIFEQTGQLANTTAQRAAVSAMLSQAATITTSVSGPTLTVGVTCRAGHKCPTGYEEGRAWILQVEQFDRDGQRVACSGCWDEVEDTIAGYNATPGDPDYDPELTEFAVRFGITGTHALQIRLQQGESFNLAVNNTVVSDTRIPPCGWNAAAYAALGLTPTMPYPPGSCTASAEYQIDSGAHRVVVRLLHWSHTTPYLKFLRDAGGSDGQALWNAWRAALSENKGRPTAIASAVAFIGITPSQVYLPVAIRGR